MNKIILYIFFTLITLFIIYNICIYYKEHEYNHRYIENIYNEKKNYYNNAYVINLNSQIDRWIRINKDFMNSSINLVRLPAIRYKSENKNISIFKGHIGCGLSFMKAIYYAKKNKLDTILIFEDDNKPLQNFDKRWNIIKRWLDKNLDKWDIFNGGARLVDWHLYDKKKESTDVFKTKMIYEIEKSEYLFQTNKLLALNWVYINKKAYDKVLKWKEHLNNYLSEPIYKNFVAIDTYLGDIKYFKTIFSIPHLALQHHGKSSTANKYYDFNETDTTLIKIFNEIYTKEVLYNHI